MPLVIQPSLVEESDHTGDEDGVGDGEMSNPNVNGRTHPDLNGEKQDRATISVYKPLETLETIKSIDWEAKGLCGQCVKEKREEWSEEQRVVWERFEIWVEEASRSSGGNSVRS